MDDENPLQICAPLETPTTKDRIPNRSGRPRTKNLIQFGPQPKSIVAQMLSEIKVKKTICDDDKVEIICLDDQIGDSVDTEKPEAYSCSICSYR